MNSSVPYTQLNFGSMLWGLVLGCGVGLLSKLRTLNITMTIPIPISIAITFNVTITITLIATITITKLNAIIAMTFSYLATHDAFHRFFLGSR